MSLRDRIAAFVRHTMHNGSDGRECEFLHWSHPEPLAVREPPLTVFGSTLTLPRSSVDG